MKPTFEFFPVDSIPFVQCHGRAEGVEERVLSEDSNTGVATRMVRILPGVDTTSEGQQNHDFWEEVYLLEGTLHDKTLGTTFEAGSYACRPPGMPHGPWVTATGCVTFEVRYRHPTVCDGDEFKRTQLEE